MVLWYNVHSTDSSSLILGSSEDDEVTQEGLLRLRSVFIASYLADFVCIKLSYCSTFVPPARMNSWGRVGWGCTSFRVLA